MAAGSPRKRRRSGSRWWSDWRHVVGVILLVMWAAYVAFASWTSPTEATPDKLRESLEHREVASMMQVDQKPSSVWSHRWWTDDAAPAELKQGRGTIVMWRGEYHQVQWTKMPSEAAAKAIIEQRNPAFAKDPVNTIREATVAGRVLALIGVVMIVLGPAPRRGSRWFWFFLLALPFALGVVAFAIGERLTDPKEQKNRLHGGFGFLAVVLAGLLLSILHGSIL